MAIYRYVTEGSFDAYMWQALETKARFIGQVITGESAVRRAEDIGGQELSYAEVKAIASGNPAVLTLAEADAELQRLNLLKKNHLDEQYVARRSVRDLPSTIENLTERLSKLTADEATATAHAGDPITLGKRSWSREDVTAVLADQLDHLPRHVRDTTRVPVGTYRGLRFGLVLHPQFPPDVYLEGTMTRQSELSRDHQGPRAVLNALERLAGGYGSECARVRQDLSIAESQLRDYRERLGKSFPHDRYFSELTELRDQLKAGLSAAAHEEGNGKGPRVDELADRIKTLKAAHTIEATPQRGQRKQAAAEEPITARIRRRMESPPSSDGALRADVTSVTEAGVVRESAPNSPGKPPLTFQERLAWERQHRAKAPPWNDSWTRNSRVKLHLPLGSLPGAEPETPIPFFLLCLLRFSEGIIAPILSAWRGNICGSSSRLDGNAISWRPALASFSERNCSGLLRSRATRVIRRKLLCPEFILSNGPSWCQREGRNPVSITTELRLLVRGLSTNVKSKRRAPLPIVARFLPAVWIRADVP